MFLSMFRLKTKHWCASVITCLNQTKRRRDAFFLCILRNIRSCPEAFVFEKSFSECRLRWTSTRCSVIRSWRVPIKRASFTYIEVTVHSCCALTNPVNLVDSPCYKCPSISRTLDNPDDFRATDPACSTETALFNLDSR